MKEREVKNNKHNIFTRRKSSSNGPSHGFDEEQNPEIGSLATAMVMVIFFLPIMFLDYLQYIITKGCRKDRNT